MTETDSVRPSRDGDQFHYYWAARQCLAMLSADPPLIAVAIEGPSPAELPDGEAVAAGEQVIDIAEYYGAERLDQADRIVYRQFKHSTKRAHEQWTLSGLSSTLVGFGRRFVEIKELDAALLPKISFALITNRPVSDKVRDTVADLANGHRARWKHESTHLRRYLSFMDDEERSEFCRAVDLGTTEDGLAALRADFARSTADYLPGMHSEIPLYLKEMVEIRATSQGSREAIKRADVLNALRTTESQLLPAPMRDTPVANRIDRTQYADIVAQMLTAREPMLVHAVGGVGKSVFASVIGDHLPPGSVCIVYDCFGAGGYRRASEPRHEPRQALLQIANELAGRRLCNPLVPYASAGVSDYTAAFLNRVAISAAAISSAQPGALLVITIDAADNAVMAAQDRGERAFAPDLLREPLPENARLVMLARTERIELLEPPYGTLKVQLNPFREVESTAYLRRSFATASDADGAEFHSRTFGNPRVQALTLDQATSLDDGLRLLGSGASDAADALDTAIAASVGKIRDDRKIAPGEVSAICEALAALRPRVPVAVIAELCAVPAEVIHSFVSDLGRPLLVQGDSVQFRDEPTETWFRKNHRPKDAALGGFIERLRPLAARYAYAASSLPQLLWEANQFAELVQLAVDGSCLPDTNELERTEIERQRVRFALKAALREDRKLAAVQLALKAGSITVGHARRLKLIKSHTHLAGDLWDGQTLEELIAHGALNSQVPGANLAYEGCLLSFAPDHRDIARSRLRSAADWMVAWTRQAASRQQDHRITTQDIAEISMGLINTDGPQAVVDYLARWKPATVAYSAGYIVAGRLIELGRADQVNALVIAAKKNVYLQHAALSQAAHAGLVIDKAASRIALATLKRRRTPLKLPDRGHGISYGDSLNVAVATISAAVAHRIAEHIDLARLLHKYLPEPHRSMGDWHSASPEMILKAHALRAHLEGGTLTDVDLAHPELAVKLTKSNQSDDRELSIFKNNITPLIPWVTLWARSVCTEAQVEGDFVELATNTYAENVSDYQTPRTKISVVARLSAQILGAQPNPELSHAFLKWLERVEPFTYWPTMTDVVRYAAPYPHLHDIATITARRLDHRVASSQTEAESKIDTYVSLASAIRPCGRDEAQYYFGRAVDTADKVGDDVADRWDAINALALQASKTTVDDDERAYALTRTFEALAIYMGDAADHERCIQTIEAFSTRSAVAIAARWRTRRAGSPDLVLQNLAGKGGRLVSADPMAAASLLPLTRNADTRTTLNAILATRPANPQRVVDVLGRYDRTAWHTSEYFEDIDAIATRHTVDLDQTSYAASIRDRRTLDPVRHQRYRSLSWDDAAAPPTTRTADLAALHQVDLNTPEGLDEARRMCAARERRLRPTDLTDAVMAVPPRNLPTVIASLQQNPHFDVYDHWRLLEKIDASRSLLGATIEASRQLAHETIRRFCSKIIAGRTSVPPLDLLSRVTGRHPDQIFDAALAALGRRQDDLDAVECFSLIRNTAQRLTPEQAQTALDQAIAELEYLIDDTTADGPWTSNLAPPADLHSCAAGYIWSALADPEDQVRWRAAHSVHLLCQLEADHVLRPLATQASTSQSGPFCDPALVFYDQHAQLWLHMALERAVTENPAQVAIFEKLIRNSTLGSDTHMLIRESGRKILLSLDQQSYLQLGDADRARLMNMNEPADELRTPKKRGRPSWNERNRGKDGKTYSFMLDFEDYWIEPLAACFGLNTPEVTSQLSDVITKKWHLGFRGTRQEDERHTKEIFQGDKTSYYKHETPPVHNLDFYLSFHALMTVAGDLTDTRPAHNDPDTYGDFASWLRDLRPTRADGRWLADRRDAVPPDQLSLLDTDYRRGPWDAQIEGGDFLQRLFEVEPGMIVVWEGSEQSHNQATELITVRSALVAPRRAAHLMAACQTAANSWDFAVPSTGDYDHEISADPYRLSAWIDDSNRISGLDEQDPLASGIRYPGPQPSSVIAEQLDLRPDEDQRHWHHHGVTAATTTVWSDQENNGGPTPIGSQGERLVITPQTLQRLTEITQMSVIFKVTIERRRRDSKGDKVDSDEPGFKYHHPDFKMVLFDREAGFIEL